MKTKRFARDLAKVFTSLNLVWHYLPPEQQHTHTEARTSLPRRRVITTAAGSIRPRGGRRER